MPPLLSKYITKERTQAIVPYLEGDILDLGCGYSRLPNWLSPTQRYVGVELTSKAIKWLQTTYPQYHFFQRNIESEDLDLDDTFDTILLAAVLEHLSNPDHLFKQLSGYLKPQGKIVITTPTPLGGWIHSVGAKLGLFYLEAADDHEMFYNFSTLQSLARRTDLEIIRYRKFLWGGNQLTVFQPVP